MRTRRENRGRNAAAANRVALIGAAREQFASEGFDASLSAIARQAGVGQGSLYRHFPDRVSLALAVFDDNVTALEALAATPASTLDDLLTLITEQTAASVAFIDMLHASDEDPRLHEVVGRVRALLEGKLLAAQRGGAIRATVTPDDLLLAVRMVAGLLAKSTPAERRDLADRAWAMLRPAITG
ncbi:TetR/AcrR family transcriptional regulator [Dactylosporangium sp. NBC_01737]|jgi:AcrR family transcriptional regulator|uniref:TetR/AcrR family transcriptional regulator n=1 Tax=Dactylosporangium sp. NBC_01737 TaxID=2975959 RepID=UPI002E165D18|nr:TetR/AcrR family transcriptional regulator [Dactylosporangium sp. NBC_01737]